MSGPYPPPGYQRPADDNGWWSGQQGRYDFPTVRYSGLGGPGWGGEPPRRRRNTARIVVAVVSVLIIIGGIVTGIVLVNQRQVAQHQAPNSTATTAPSTVPPTFDTSTVNPDDPGVPDGSTTLTLTVGACVTAHVDTNEQYTAVRQVQCGSSQSDLVLAQVTPDMTGCADHQYLRLTAPSTGVYCFTLDIRQGDCVDANYLRQPCAGASFMVLQTEQGPGNADSCAATAGATHWVPVGRNPVRVGCLGAPK